MCMWSVEATCGSVCSVQRVESQFSMDMRVSADMRVSMCSVRSRVRPMYTSDIENR